MKESQLLESEQQPTQTLGAKALQLLTSLFAGLLVGVMFGLLALVISGVVLFVFIYMFGRGESVLNMALLLSGGVCLPAALIITLIVGLIASVVINKRRSRKSVRANRAFTITCLGTVAIGACLAWLVIVVNLALPRVPAEERAALVALYKSANGDYWRNHQDWLSWWKSPCHWEGVVCRGDSLTAYVTGLRLERNRLSGSIPPELGQLSNLKQFYLFDNQLSGAVPSELGNLSDLEDIMLLNNQLTGPIPPELGNLSNLRWLNLSNNQLSGDIPPELGNLSALESLFLRDNQLTGSIPVELSRFANLERSNALAGVWRVMGDGMPVAGDKIHGDIILTHHFDQCVSGICEMVTQFIIQQADILCGHVFIEETVSECSFIWKGSIFDQLHGKSDAAAFNSHQYRIDTIAGCSRH